MSHKSRKREIDLLPDEALCAMARGADNAAARRAATALLGRYRERVYRWCFGRVRDPEQALDLAQDVLLAAHRGLGSFDGRSRFSSWLYAVARNRCLNALRQPPLLGGDLEPDALPSTAPGQDDLLDRREGEERLLALIQRALPPLDRQVLWMRCVEKMPVEQITRLLKLEESSGARAVLQRARRHLRAALAAEEGDEARG